MLENHSLRSCVASRFFAAARRALCQIFTSLMFVAILNLSVSNTFAQQSPTSPTTSPAPTTTPSLQNGSFWSSGPSQPQPNSSLVIPQPSSVQPNHVQPSNTAPPAMPSLNPPANNPAPMNAPLTNAAPMNSPYGSGTSSYPTGTSVYGAPPFGSSTSVPSMPAGPALSPPNNSLPLPSNSPAPTANSFSQPPSSIPPTANFGQPPSGQYGSPQFTSPQNSPPPSFSGPSLGAPMNASPYGNPTQNFQPATTTYPSNQNFNTQNTPAGQYDAAPQFGGPAQNSGQPQFGQQSQFTGQPNFTSQGVNQPTAGTSLQSAPTIATWGEFVTAKPIAMVGGEPIISYDIEEFFIRGMENLREKDPNTPAPTEDEKKAYTRIILKQMIETKIIYADALKNVQKEMLEKMRSGVKEKFESDYVKMLLERNKVKTRAELEKVMVKKGTSLERESQKFFEQSLADMWERQNVKKISVVPLADVVSYYKQHQSEYEFSAKARWEQLMISFDKVKDKVQAQNTLATMGNKVIQGAKFGDIAEKESHGPTAYQKGQYDWTSKDALKSKVLNDAIFTLPINQLSVILEDESGYHIIRVLERKEAGCVPFEEAQVAIRKDLIEAEQKKIKDAYLTKVKERIAVWTIFDNEKPASEVAKEQDPLRK